MQEWLEKRLDYVTSTEIAALFGLSPYVTEYELYHRKLERTIDVIPDNKRMMWGRKLEAVIAQAAVDELGFGIDVATLEQNPFTEDSSHRMAATLDFVHNGVIIECKNVDAWIWKQQWTDEEAPDHIELQVQAAMACSGASSAVIAALVGGNDLKLYRRQRDDEVIAALRQRAAKFWQRIEDKNPPPPVYERDADFIIGRYQDGSGEPVDMAGNAQFDAMLNKYSRLGSEIKQMEAERKSAKAQIYEMIGDAGAAYGDAFKLNASTTKDLAGTLITADIVGTTINARKGYRQFRITNLKGAEK